MCLLSQFVLLLFSYKIFLGLLLNTAGKIKPGCCKYSLLKNYNLIIIASMEILSIKVMRGPNYWSTYRKQLIVMKLDLQEAEQTPTNKIDGCLLCFL